MSVIAVNAGMLDAAERTNIFALILDTLRALPVSATDIDSALPDYQIALVAKLLAPDLPVAIHLATLMRLAAFCNNKTPMPILLHSET